MDFFEAQARAKKRTSRLVLMFALAVIGTIIAMYLAAVVALGQTHQRRVVRDSRYGGYVVADDSSQANTAFWQPQLFAGVAVTTLVIVGLGSMYKWSQFSAGGRAVAESVNGRRVDPNTTDLHERQLLNVVEEMAIASGVPVPAVYLLDDEPGINAFAAGLTTNDAIIAVTRGTLQKLNRDELQGVIGHEFSHILNGDMRLNLRIAATIFGILVLGVIGRGILWSLRGTRVRGRNSGGTVAVILVVGLALLIIGYVGYFFGRLIQAAVSRQREFLADASSVQFTRNPAGITGALKKIGGYAIGSTMESNQSAAIGHFFFAQAFRSNFGGAWATHPPLEERIRAIEPAWDGKFFVPPEVVDVAHESFASAGLAGSRGGRAATVPAATAVAAALDATTPPRLPPTTATAAVHAIGSLSPAQIANAQLLLDTTPPALRTAAQNPADACVLLYGLLLDDDPAIRATQRDIVERHVGIEALRQLDQLQSSLQLVREEHRLPLLQLAVPAIKQVSRNALQPFLATLDDLIRADNQISPFEFALQRILTRALALGDRPAPTVVQYYSFNAVVEEVSTVLSVLARASTSDPSVAPQAFAAGAAQIKLIESQLQYSDEVATDLAAFDAALDKLANGSLVIKQRTLVAAAHVVQADGQVLITEFELLRAIAAALDVPMPPLAAAAA